MSADRFEVKIVTVGDRAQLVHDGVVLRSVARTWADYYAGIEERRLRMAAIGGPRPCITCGVVFESEGPHNRMCGDCRGAS